MNYQKAALHLLAAGALAAAPAAASAETTINAVANTKTTINTGKTTFTQVEVLKSGDKAIGGDVVHGTYDQKTKTVDIDVSASLDGGMIYATFKDLGDAKMFSGKITGGTGAYQGASGTIDATDMGKKKTGVVFHIK